MIMLPLRNATTLNPAAMQTQMSPSCLSRRKSENDTQTGKRKEEHGKHDRGKTMKVCHCAILQLMFLPSVSAAD
jgi:hypothetical protein